MTNHSGDADDRVERERFEKWCAEDHSGTGRYSSGQYMSLHTENAWIGWQARAQSATQDDGLLGELEGLTAKLKKGGASLPHFANGSAESAMEGGLSIALMLVEEIIAKYRGK